MKSAFASHERKWTRVLVVSVLVFLEMGEFHSGFGKTFVVHLEEVGGREKNSGEGSEIFRVIE